MSYGSMCCRIIIIWILKSFSHAFSNPSILHTTSFLPTIIYFILANSYTPEENNEWMVFDDALIPPRHNDQLELNVSCCIFSTKIKEVNTYEKIIHQFFFCFLFSLRIFREKLNASNKTFVLHHLCLLSARNIKIGIWDRE